MAYRALLIANWEYADPDEVFAPLKGPRNDLELMAKALTDTDVGLFKNVTSRSNLSWGQLREEFNSFLQSARPDDNLLIYFSGHGDRLHDGRLALCGVNTRSQRLAATSFDTKELREWIENANRAPSTMVILDCCYAGAMKGAVTDQDIVSSLGSGTLVLSSGGSQPTPDSKHEDEPSPFTAALAAILVDPEFPGDPDGFVTVDKVYERLVAYDPPLRPPPKRNVQSQGTFPLARRKREEVSARPPLKGFHEPEVEAISLRFEDEGVTASLGEDTREQQPLHAFDAYRTVHRMSQLADAVLRVADDSDEWAQRTVRRAWNCVGVNLFETALPASVQGRIQAAAKAPDIARVLKLRLTFEDNEPATAMESYPWEYLYQDRDPGSAPDTPEPQPMALATGLLLERVIRADGPATLEAKVTGPTTVGLVCSDDGPTGQAGTTMADSVNALADLNTVFDLRGREASWKGLVDAVEQRPELLVAFVPVRRGRYGAEIGFWAKDPYPEWHSAEELIRQFGSANLQFSAIVLVTFAARPAQDAFRATSELAGMLAKAGAGPVVFISHAPGYARYVPELGPDAFPVLFVDAFTQGVRFDHAVYYAKNRVAVQAGQESRRCFGVPGYYIAEPDAPQGAIAKPGGPLPSSAGRRHATPAAQKTDQKKTSR